MSLRLIMYPVFLCYLPVHLQDLLVRVSVLLDDLLCSASITSTMLHLSLGSLGKQQLKGEYMGRLDEVKGKEKAGSVGKFSSPSPSVNGSRGINRSSSNSWLSSSPALKSDGRDIRGEVNCCAIFFPSHLFSILIALLNSSPFLPSVDLSSFLIFSILIHYFFSHFILSLISCSSCDERIGWLIDSLTDWRTSYWIYSCHLLFQSNHLTLRVPATGSVDWSTQRTPTASMSVTGSSSSFDTGLNVPLIGTSRATVPPSPSTSRTISPVRYATSRASDVLPRGIDSAERERVRERDSENEREIDREREREAGQCRCPLETQEILLFYHLSLLHSLALDSSKVTVLCMHRSVSYII